MFNIHFEGWPNISVAFEFELMSIDKIITDTTSRIPGKGDRVMNNMIGRSYF